MIDYQDAKKIAGMLAAVGEPTRLMILHRLTQGPHHVGQLAELIGIPMVNMSHHLGVMRQAGLLEDEKDGRRVVYKFRSDIYSPGGETADTIGTLKIGSYRLSILKGDDGDGEPSSKSKKKNGK